MTAIYLVRHGQASFGRSDYDNLSELGHEQARLLGATLQSRLREVHAVRTGAMRRHLQTAQGCLETMRCSVAPEQDAGFNEFDHDEIITRFRPRYKNRLVLAAELASTLRPRQAFQALFSQAVERWVSGEYDGEYSETWPEFKARCHAALTRLAESLGPKRSALVFTSAGPIAAICQALLQVPDDHAFKLQWTLVNCSISKVLVGARGLHLSSLNEHGHFEVDSRRLVTYR